MPNQLGSQFMNFSQQRGENPFLTQKNEKFTGFGASERPRMPNNQPFGRATGVEDDLARATMQQSPSKPDRETFGVVPENRMTMKLGGGMEERKSGISLLDTYLKADVYKAINLFVAEAGADFPGVSLHQTQKVLRKFMADSLKGKGEVREDEIIKFFDTNCIGSYLFFKEALM